jgi:hypothetical protein
MLPPTLPPSSSVEAFPSAAARASAAARSDGPNAASHECGATAVAAVPPWLAFAFAALALADEEDGHSADAEEGSSRQAAEEDRDALLLLLLLLL